MPQFAQRFGLNLPNAFAGHVKRLADFFERMLRSVVHAKAHADNFFFARTQRAQHVLGSFLQVPVDGRVGGRNLGLVFDQITKGRISLLANRRFQRNRYAHNLAHFAYGRLRNIHLLGNFRRGGLVSQRLHQLPRSANQLVDHFDHVYRQANGARLVGQGPADGLANPPRRIGGKLIAAAVLELVDGLHQADVAFLNQVEELQPAVAILFSDGNDQSQVGFDQFMLRLLRAHFTQDDGALRAMQLREGHSSFFFQPRHLNAMLPLRSPILFLEIFAARGRDLLFQSADLAVEGAHDLDRLIHPLGQALLFRVVQPEGADDERNPHHLTSQARSAAQMLASFLFRRNGGQLFSQPAGGFVMFIQLIDATSDLFDALLQNLFGDFFFVNDYRVLDGAQAALQVFADRQNLQDYDRRARKRLELGELSTFNALGNFNFLFTSEQRRSAHFAQVNPHRISGHIGSARRQIEFDLVRFLPHPLFQRGERRARFFQHVKAARANAAQQIVNILYVRILCNQIVPLVIDDIRLGFVRH